MNLQYIEFIRVDHTLFALSILIAIVSYLGISPYVNFYVTLIFSVVIFLSIILFYRKVKINQWLVNILSVIFLLIPFLGFSLEDIILPSVEALSLIVSLRFLGRKTPREYFQIYLMCLLLLGASTVFSISWFFLLRLGLFLICCLFSILIITYSKETLKISIDSRCLKGILTYTLLILVFSVPLSLIFFVFLPRTPNPLIDIGLGGAKTGFSSTVNLGNISTIEEDKSVVMRIKMEKIDNRELYWRMITLDNFDGKNWTLTQSEKLPRESVTGTLVSYNVLLEPTDEIYLPVLDFPLKVNLPNLIVEHPGIYKIKFISSKSIKYNAISYINYKYQSEKPDSRYLQLPSKISKRLIALTEEITSDASDKIKIVNRILEFLSRYEYSLKNLPRGDNPIDEFIFNTKKGNCEYFATSMAIMLRIKGIHSRVVGGFRGGSYNPFGGYYLVRAADAHLWVEAWIDGFWIRLDPSGTRPLRLDEPVLYNLLDYIWNNFVVGYDFTKQIRLTQTILSPKIAIKRDYLLIPVFLFLLVALIYGYRVYLMSKSPLVRFLKKLENAGYRREKNQGLEEFTYLIKEDKIKGVALKFVELYQSIYFKDKKATKDEEMQLEKILEELNEVIKSRGS